MNNKHNEPVEPTRFETTPESTLEPDQPASSATAPKGQTATTPTWVAPALGGLLLLAGLVFFWLPSQVSPPTIEHSAPTAPKTDNSATREISPWMDAQVARERKQAQEILALLLDVQFALEELEVSQWAGEEFERALQIAQEADAYYRDRQFEQAIQSYTQSLHLMEALEASSEKVFTRLVDAGRAAVAADQAKKALETLQLALLIEPFHPEAEALFTRAENLEQVIALRGSAAEARQGGALGQARELLQQALVLDPEHTAASNELATVEYDISQENFNRAMTEGYLALDDRRYDDAQAAFQRAQKIVPTADETVSALLQVQVSRTEDQIRQLRARAQQAEAGEQWQEASVAYRQILEIDKSVVFARSGLITTRKRADLDKTIRDTIDNPLRLSDSAVFLEAQKTYRAAAKLQPRGPVLEEQLENLATALKLANTPIPITIISNRLTDVTVYRVAHLGILQQEQLSLKPGVYTAVGIRNGYRDVRQEFTVSPDAPNQVIEVSCTDPV